LDQHFVPSQASSGSPGTVESRKYPTKLIRAPVLDIVSGPTNELCLVIDKPQCQLPYGRELIAKDAKILVEGVGVLVLQSAKAVDMQLPELCGT
jgi:hypothetical protein